MELYFQMTMGVRHVPQAVFDLPQLNHKLDFQHEEAKERKKTCITIYLFHI